MRRTSQKLKAEQWCKEQGWTELFEQEGKYYAFPPGAVIPMPVELEKQKNTVTGRFPFNYLEIISKLFNKIANIFFRLLGNFGLFKGWGLDVYILDQNIINNCVC